MIKYLAILISLISFFSCRKEHEQIISPELEPFVYAFFEEANQRNNPIKLTNFDLTVQLMDIAHPDYIGTCRSRKNEIIIDKQYWLTHDKEHKTWLMFHELGHCILGRSHRNELSNNGTCLSYMKGGKEDDFSCSLNLYSVYWTSYYLDEFFCSTRLLPNWYTQNLQYIDTHNNIVYQVNSTFYTEQFIDSLIFNKTQNFVIEASFLEPSNQANIFRLVWSDYSFLYCPNCTINQVEIKKGDQILYNHPSIRGKEIRMTIMKKDDLYLFFFDKKLMHIFEYTHWSVNRIKTYLFDKKMNIHIRIYAFDV